MTKARGIALVVAAWLVVSVFTAHLWVTYPASFPTLPKPLWEWVDSYYQSSNAEEVADLEFVVTLTLSAASWLFACPLVYLCWRKLHLPR
jgi:hypothetical protein